MIPITRKASDVVKVSPETRTQGEISLFSFSIQCNESICYFYSFMYLYKHVFIYGLIQNT